MIIDPFYAEYDNRLAGWLNRVVILLELAAIVIAIREEVMFEWTGLDVPWNYIVIGVGGLLAMRIINALLRFLCRIFNLFCNGSEDPNELAKIHSRHEGRRQRRASRKTPRWKSVPVKEKSTGPVRVVLPDSVDGKHISSREKTSMQLDILKKIKN